MSVDGDPFHLQRFVDAQLQVITDVRQELAAGRKRTHWMWFVFPQIAGLGRSEIATRYAIGSAEEARSYLAHPVLGERLLECVELVCRHSTRSAYEIFGSPDDLKFRSSLTLFGAVSRNRSSRERCRSSSPMPVRTITRCVCSTRCHQPERPADLGFVL